MKKKKKILIILFSIIGLFIIVFLLLGPRGGPGNQAGGGGGGGMPMPPPVRVSYPKVDQDANYTKRIFDTSYVHEVDIKIANKDWEDLKANPLAKKKYAVDIIVDGIKFKNVSFKTKGNSSLKNVAQGPAEGPAANRYSFKVDFGKYEKGQNYYGLNLLNLNNIYGDASYLNDYVAYELFRQMGIPAPLTSFVYLKINGQNLGLYSAVEEVDDAFFDRNLLDGLLYKPGQTSGKNRGSSLTYVDEDYNNYIDIFNSAEGIITKADKDRMIQSLKSLNEEKDLESVLDTSEIIKYFAAHNFLLSYDSYTGKSIHNYYLVEKDGKLSMLPWDYNLSFGRYNMTEDITTIVNYGIDTPLSRAEEKDRPMWRWIINHEPYKNEYHQAMKKLLTFFDSGEFDQYVDAEYEVIKPYVPLDFSAFYNYQQVETAVTKMKEFCKLRVKSIHLQLDGELSTKTNEQDPKKRIDASSIQLSDMGFIADDTLKHQNTTTTEEETNSDSHHTRSHSSSNSNEQ